MKADARNAFRESAAAATTDASSRGARLIFLEALAAVATYAGPLNAPVCRGRVTETSDTNSAPSAPPTTPRPPIVEAKAHAREMRRS